MNRPLCVLAVVCCLVAAREGAAHPMGNFSINHYASLRAKGNELRLLYRLDVAELPTVEEMRSLDADSDGRVSAEKKAAYLARKGAELTSNLSLRIGGRPVRLSAASADLQLRPGAAGLPILLLSIEYRIVLDRAAGPLRVEYDDQNYPTRTGWREVIAVAGDGWKVVESDVPAKDVSGGLLNYPADLIAAPPQVTTANVAFEPRDLSSATDTDEAPATAPPGGGATTPRDRLTQLVAAPRLSPGVLFVGLGVSFVLGAMHAMGPGHGKTVVAAYLVGSRGTAGHALLLGVVVTAAHVAGVFLLGFTVLVLSKYVVPESLYPWLGFASGMTIVVVGAQQFVLRAAGLRRDGEDPAHDPSRGGHAHAVPDRVSLTNLVAMGISGGMIPCPSALLVLLGAVALHRTGLGLVLILVFSTGLAAVLVAMGMAAIHARRLLGKLQWRGPEGFMRRLPLISSAAVAVLGLGLAVQSLSGAGILRLHVPGKIAVGKP